MPEPPSRCPSLSEKPKAHAAFGGFVVLGFFFFLRGVLGLGFWSLVFLGLGCCFRALGFGLFGVYNPPNSVFFCGLT